VSAPSAAHVFVLGNMVQEPEQYHFIYKAVLGEARRLGVDFESGLVRDGLLVASPESAAATLAAAASSASASSKRGSNRGGDSLRRDSTSSASSAKSSKKK
jgi:hypothetical protein